MELSPDIGSEDLGGFIQEAEEQLELLDADLVRLEQERDNSTLLQEIFRASHTLNGSSGMIGHRLMADLGHSMENLLDQLRQGTTEVNSTIVDALLGGLDLLRAMTADLSSSTDSEIDEAVSVLDSLSQTADWQAPGQDFAQAGPAKLHLDPEDEERVLVALDDDSRIDLDSRVDLVTGNINSGFSWVPVGCFQILDGLSQLADTIISNPSFADIEANKESNLVQAVLSTDQDTQTLQPFQPGFELIIFDSLTGMVARAEDRGIIDFFAGCKKL